MGKKDFIINWIKNNGDTGAYNLIFVKAFCKMFPTKSANTQTYVRMWLKRLEARGFLRSYKYSFGGSKFDSDGNNQATWGKNYSVIPNQ